MKWLIRLLIPSPKTLAKTAAKTLQKLVNESGKAEQIAKYGSIADRATEVQKWITETLADGSIDAKETDEIAARLEPLFQKLVELV